jgi:outer membrane protein
LEIGTMAPLDVVTADSVRRGGQAGADQLAEQPELSAADHQAGDRPQSERSRAGCAAVIPTDRVSLEELPEEKQPIEDLVQEAFKQRPELEQAVLTLKNDEITLRGAKNALLPTVDVFGYYGGSGPGWNSNPNCDPEFCPPAAATTPAATARRFRTPSTTRLRTRASDSTSIFRSATVLAQSVRRGR